MTLSRIPKTETDRRKGPLQDFPIFVINLDRSHDRRDAMHAHLTKLGLRFEFVSAVDGSRLPDDMQQLHSTAKAQEKIGRPLSPGEVGCALSHYWIYRRIIDESIDVALIIEDDVALSWDLVPVLCSAIEKRRDWELINLITDVEEALLVDQPLIEPYVLTRFMEMPNRTGAYLLRTSAAEKLVEAALPIRMAADTLTGELLQTGSVVRGVFPPLATLRPFKSTFQRGNYPPKSIVWDRKILSPELPRNATLNPKLIPSRIWVVWHTIRSYLGPTRRALTRLLQTIFSRR